MSELGIEYQTVRGLDPAAFVHLAADLGCRFVSMKVAGGGIGGNPPFSLLDDPPLRRRFTDALADRGVTVSLAEGFIVRPGHDLRSDAPALDVLAESGATRANTVTMDPDLHRSFDQFAEFAHMAAARGMTTTMEFAKSLTVADLPTALAALAHVGRADFGLLVDTMHAARSGCGPGELEMLDPSWIGYIHLSDHTATQCHPDYRDDSADRRIPGEGELPLVEMLAALPALPVAGVECPMLPQAGAAPSVREYTGRAVEGARQILRAANELREVKARGCRT